MAKNRENSGLFDVSDLTAKAQENIRNGNREEAAAAPARKVIKRETKSKRINLLVKPSTYAAIVAKAEETGVSVNELINGYMEDILKC